MPIEMLASDIRLVAAGKLAFVSEAIHLGRRRRARPWATSLSLEASSGGVRKVQKRRRAVADRQRDEQRTMAKKRSSSASVSVSAVGCDVWRVSDRPCCSLSRFATSEGTFCLQQQNRTDKHLELRKSFELFPGSSPTVKIKFRTYVLGSSGCFYSILRDLHSAASSYELHPSISSLRRTEEKATNL